MCVYEGLVRHEAVLHTVESVMQVKVSDGTFPANNLPASWQVKSHDIYL